MDQNGKRVEVTRTYLEITQPGDLKAAYIVDDRVRIERAMECPVSFFCYLYREVGRHYHWIDRLVWTDAEVRAYLASPGVSLWVMYGSGVPAGYFELQRYED